MTAVNIRRLAPEELDHFYDLLESVAAEGRWIGTEAPVDREARRARELDRVEEGSAVLVAAEIGDTIVGCAGLHEVIPGLYEVGMMIQDGFRGQGIGSRLLETCIDLAQAREAYKLTLQVWPHNTAAIALYEKYGFSREGYLRHHWRRKSGEVWDSVVMGLVLDPAADSR